MESGFRQYKRNKPVIFTEEMKRYLKDNYHLQSNEELALYFGVTVKRVKNQADRQYLNKKGESK